MSVPHGPAYCHSCCFSDLNSLSLMCYRWNIIKNAPIQVFYFFIMILLITFRHVLKHCWAHIILFLSCVSRVIFDLNLKALQYTVFVVFFVFFPCPRCELTFWIDPPAWKFGLQAFNNIHPWSFVKSICFCCILYVFIAVTCFWACLRKYQFSSKAMLSYRSIKWYSWNRIWKKKTALNDYPSTTQRLIVSYCISFKHLILIWSYLWSKEQIYIYLRLHRCWGLDIKQPCTQQKRKRQC